MGLNNMKEELTFPGLDYPPMVEPSFPWLPPYMECDKLPDVDRFLDGDEGLIYLYERTGQIKQ